MSGPSAERPALEVVLSELYQGSKSGLVNVRTGDSGGIKEDLPRLRKN